MRSTLFSSSLINLMGETGFRLFTDSGEGYRIQNRDTAYRFVDHQGFWTLEKFEREVKEGETRTFRTHYELEQFLITQLRKLSRYRELEQLP